MAKFTAEIAEDAEMLVRCHVRINELCPDVCEPAA
jgi:hypothetical protein